MQAVCMTIVLLPYPLACEPHWTATYCPLLGKPRNATGDWTVEAMFASDSESIQLVLHKIVSILSNLVCKALHLESRGTF